ncbi:MAG TPA: DNA polymerase III subunit alpha [Xanthobacteraceae bacterium]|nr:DNA polymerase III subunit alpha [Xanthobacteraceae bacterium]
MSDLARAVGFVHLHVHSSYSLLEGALKIAQLAALAKADREPALALTDTGNLFAALEFSEKMASVGIQPIVGCSLAVDFADEPPAKHGTLARLPRVVLLAATETGYRHLIALVSKSHLEVAEGTEPHVSLAWLQAHSEGLIALTGGPDGPLDRAFASGQPELAKKRVLRLAEIHGDRLYVELQRHGLESEKLVEPALIGLAFEHGLPLVATNEPYFAARDDYEAHDALLCIAEGRLVAESGRRQLTPEHYFKTRQEMAELFADLPEALASSVEIARRCSFRTQSRAPILPRFSIGGKAADETAELRRRAEAGLAKRMAEHGITQGFTEEEYRERLAFELDVIGRMNYSGYFLIVADFIQWAKAQGIPVGPGRGSGAGSLVSYALTITDLDPIRFGLLFERFLNPERVSMPDFDVDFCQDRRDEVIRYVRERYGREQVAQIITFGSLQARGVMRDVGRVLEMPYGQVDRICKLIPINPTNPVTLARAIEDEPRLQEARKEDPRVKRAFDIALKLEGLHRHASTHAAGIVIGDRPLTELVPLYRDPKSNMPATQFNMKWVEAAGLVKFDFLGLKTLTVIETAVKLLKKRGIEIDIARIPLDDPAPYEMISRGDTVGVFQIESAGMRKALADMRPDRFEDIIALVALYRPGPMANIPTYNARKHDKEKPDYIHPKLETVLRETFGVIVYQEQVMQAAQLLAGYSLGEADLLRRAMGKKIRSEMRAQRARFVSGAVERGVERTQADAIFDLLERFAEYGFNKSHAAAYALVAYQTAYLKAHYSVEFLAASMTLDMDNTDKLADFRREADRLGIKVEPPSVNLSGENFGAGEGTIIYALAAIKGVGRQAVEAIVKARGEKPYADLADFAARIDARTLNKRTLECLAAAGAFDCLEPNRARAFAAVDAMLAYAQRRSEDAARGQTQLFGAGPVRATIHAPETAPWLPAERLKREYDAIGFFLSGHPLDDYATALARLRVQQWADFARAVRAGATAGRLAATVVSRTERRIKSGSKMGIIGLSDPTGHFEAVIFAEGLAQYRDLLDPGTAVLLQVGAELQGDEVRVRIHNAESLDEAASKAQRGLRVFVRSSEPIDLLTKRLAPNGGKAEKLGEVCFVLTLADGSEVEVKLPGRYPISPQIAGAMKAVPGVVAVQEV